ncbi:transposase [Agrobacterium rosae]
MSRPAASLGLMRMIEAVPDRLDGSPRQLRRFWSDEFKATAVEQACQPGVNMSAVARQIGSCRLNSTAGVENCWAVMSLDKQQWQLIRRASHLIPTPSSRELVRFV